MVVADLTHLADYASGRQLASGMVTRVPAPVDDLLGLVTRTRLVLYMSVSAASMRTLVAAELAGPVRLVLEGLEDQPERLRRVVESAARPDLGADVLARVEPTLRRVPPLLATAIRELLLAPTTVGDARALADRAGMTRRSLDRWLTRVGLAPVRTLLNVALACDPVIGACAGRRTGAQARVAHDVLDRATIARRLRRLLGPDVKLDRMSRTAAADLLAARLHRSTAEPRRTGTESVQSNASAVRSRSAGAA